MLVDSAPRPVIPIVGTDLPGLADPGHTEEAYYVIDLTWPHRGEAESQPTTVADVRSLTVRMTAQTLVNLNDTPVDRTDVKRQPVFGDRLAEVGRSS